MKRLSEQVLALGIILLSSIFSTTAYSQSASPDVKGLPYFNPYLSVGETVAPLEDYSVTSTDSPDYEKPHNTRIKKPYHALKPKLEPVVPAHVRPNSRDVLSDIEDRPFFDYNGWQTFIGLIWPADPDRRGVPDSRVTEKNFANHNQSKKNSSESTPVVFETLLTDIDTFPSATATGGKPKQPDDWFSSKYKRPFNLTATSKAGALDEAFSSPLIDQNRQYTRYNVQVNRVFYEYIRQNKYYLKENLPKAPSPVAIPPLVVPKTWKKDSSEPLTLVLQPQTNTTVIQPVNGNSITLKTAWRIMIKENDSSKPWRKKDDLSRYYTTTANVQNAVTGAIEKKLVGLVGMHIVVRTTQFPEGLWSTFGHVDNLQTDETHIRPSYNGNGNFSSSGFSYQPNSETFLSEKKRKPVEVNRIYKIPDTPVATSKHLPFGISTQGMNKSFQKLLKGTVWQYYQLEATQWPTDPGSFYAKPFFYPRGLENQPGPTQPQAVQDAYNRADAAATVAYPRWSGLPIPQVGALNPILETYFQNPPSAQPMENTSCMGCHYSASDLGYVWVFKLRTSPSPYNQGRVNPRDTKLASEPANTEVAPQLP